MNVKGVVKIKGALTKKVKREPVFGILLIIWGPILLYINYVNTYLDHMYAKYSTYYEYLGTESSFLIGLFFISMILGVCLIISNIKWLREVLKIISIVFVSSTLLLGL